MNCLYITLFSTQLPALSKHLLSLGTSFCIPSHRSLPPALWTTSWLLLAPYHRRRNDYQRDVSLGEETSGNVSSPVTMESRNQTFTFCVDKSYDGNAPRIWRDFGSALPFQTRLTQTKPVLPFSNDHGSQVKEQGWRQGCHNKHSKFPYRLTRDVSLLSGHASYLWGDGDSVNYICFLVIRTSPWRWRKHVREKWIKYIININNVFV